MSQLLQFARVEANKRANNKVGTVLLDTLYSTVLYSTVQYSTVQYSTVQAQPGHQPSHHRVDQAVMSPSPGTQE